MDYELIKLTTGYILCEVGGYDIDLSKIKTLKDLQELQDNNKIIATTEVFDDNKVNTLHRLKLDECDFKFDTKETRQPKVSDKYKDAKYGTLEELQGIQEIVRLQMYNYLSGRVTHKTFLKFYNDYQTMLHEHNIIKVNEWELDEDLDDEYFNDDLDSPTLSRELPNDKKSNILVSVSRFKNEEGFVEFF
jgi:hypothetical protein